jgi:Fic family protein
MKEYIHERADWPEFFWNEEKLAALLSDTRYRQKSLLQRMEALGFGLKSEATLHALTLEVVKTHEIEGEQLDAKQVRSAIARRLGIDLGGLAPADQKVEGVVDMMLDATQGYAQELTDARLFYWHEALFHDEKHSGSQLLIGAWRINPDEFPMQVYAGPEGREVVYFEAPSSDRLAFEMKYFLDWFNAPSELDPLIKAAIAHLWFVTIHPFDDGNGRIARAITDMQLCRADETAQRFYSMSDQIKNSRKGYYNILAATQKSQLDITNWLQWFLECLGWALYSTDKTIANIIKKASKG